MATIVYLDPDDEITSAATRIRTASGVRVGLVVPNGSRVATSRINFRLLAREAQTNGRRLDIVAPDPSARALAAAAGLPVFASVGEYEAALDGASEAADVMPVGEPAVTAADRGRSAVPGVASGAAAATGAGAAAPRGAAAAPRGAAAAGGRRGPIPVADADQQAELDEIVARSRQAPLAGPRRRRPGAGAIAAVLVLVLALGVSAAAAVLVLPAAEITVTPRIVPVGPISLTVTADPAATAVDPRSRVIPAQTIQIPVEASGDFAATGKRVATTKATGGVRWTNCDPSASYTIPKGSLVRTSGGTAFATDEVVFLPVAGLSGTPPSVTVRCSTSEVAVTATEAGEGGNVAAGAIKVIPARYNRALVSVSNAAATAGGSRQEFKRVDQKDVDAALATLKAELEAGFATELANPDRVPAGSTVFPETAVAGDPVPAVDPATLVGQEVDTFSLAMTATGTVLAVDAGPVRIIAEALLASAVTPGFDLVEGSVSVEVGAGTATEGLVDFAVTGSARQLRPLDAAALEREVLGLSKADATRALEAYGDVAITLWPGWVSSVPTLDQRVTVSLAAPVDASPRSTPMPTPKPTATAKASQAAGSPDASPDASASEPVPSG